MSSSLIQGALQYMNVEAAVQTVLESLDAREQKDTMLNASSDR